MDVNSEWISRDKIRFSLLQENQEYFANETDVFDIFINYINQSLENPTLEKIFIDATHITPKSRKTVLDKIIHKENIEELNCVSFITPVEVCVNRNNNRTGRSKVPTSVVRRMYFSYVKPTLEEGFDNIIIIDENGEEIKNEYLGDE